MATHPLSEEQMLEALRLWSEYGSVAEAARQAGIPRPTMQNRLERARQAFPDGPQLRSELDERIADGFELRGYSQLTKTAAGEPIWLKTRKAERDYWESVQEAIRSLQPVERIAPPPHLPDSDLIPWLQIGDGHVGMHAWEAETGASYDIKICEAEFHACVTDLLDHAPKCERLVINDLGDGTHYENYKALTEASGNPMDIDTRFPKMIRSYIDLICYTVERALERAQTVDCIFNQGNHSRTNDIWIAELIRRQYGPTGRVNVLDNRATVIAYRMGKTLVAVHHGDKMRPTKFRDAVVCDYAEDWGETEFRYLDGGHVHSKKSEELAGCIFESWNNMAPNDKHHHEAGWRSKQCMSLVTRSRSYGEVERKILPVQRVRDLIRAKHPDHYVPQAMRAFAA